MISKNVQPKKKNRIVIILDSFGFPEGMASTQRVRLIAKALIENGDYVNVMCVRSLERTPHVENTEIYGNYQGIDFEYTPGTTVRSKNFWMRRFIDIKGILIAIFRLFKYKNRGEINCIYYYGNILSGSLNRWIFYLVTNLLDVPLVIELCERPWMLERKSFIDRFLHPLISVDGVIVISSFLKEWVVNETRGRERYIQILDLPILVDIEEQQVSTIPFNEASVYVMFAGSTKYYKTVGFILDSMMIVWETYPNCQLILTGYRSGEVAIKWLQDQLERRNIYEMVSISGYLPRSELLNLYQGASALLIPLFDDIRSKARFPTKIGEYLCSGNPIVTTNVGEISIYFDDEVNAFICDPDNPELYAQKIMDAIAPWNREIAEKVGKNGRLLAENSFHYSNHKQSLEYFFSSICQ